MPTSSSSASDLPDHAGTVQTPAPDVCIPGATTVPPPAAPGAEATAAPGPTRRLGRYELGEEIAHGGMGTILAAHDPTLNRDLAVKVLKPELDDRPDLVRRFIEEAQITAQLPHPGIVPVHELGQDDQGLPFLAMKLVRGQTLEQLLTQRRSPAEDLPRFVAIFEQVCQAVAFAHSHRVIHRDLKPANVMVGRFGEVQVMDWGLAKPLDRAPAAEEQAAGEAAASVIRTLRTEGAAGLVGSSIARGATGAGTVLGTPAYMPPEQAAGQIDKLDERCDVFGLGAILCEILTGRPPYVDPENWRIVYLAALGEQEETCRQLDGCGADAELVALVKECLSADIDRRPRDAGVVTQRVAAYQRGVQEKLRQAEQERAAAQARAEEERKRRRLVLVVAAGGLLLLGGGLWLLQQKWARQQLAGEMASQALERARSLLEKGWAANDLEMLKTALVEAKHASEIAENGAAATAVREEAKARQQEIETQLARAEQNRVLLQNLLDIAGPREMGSYATESTGPGVIIAHPREKEYVAAFRQRWPDLDINQTDEAEVVARLGAEPRLVVEEVLAGLDSWILELRKKQPEAKWRRLVRVADALDRNSQRRELRALLVSEWQPSVGIVVGLTSVSLPWTTLWELEYGERWQRLAQLHKNLNPAREPVLSMLLLARLSRQAGDAAGAERVLRQAWTAHPNEVVVLLALAQLMEARGRLGEAIEWYQVARTQRPELGVALAAALREAGRVEEGEGVLRDLFEKQPNNPKLYHNLGLLLERQKKWSEAEAAYRKAIELEPDSAETYTNLGTLFRDQLDLPAEAEAAFRKAIELKPDLAEAHCNLGRALQDQKKPAKAEAAYRKAIAILPDYANAYNGLGEALQDQEKPAEAEAAFRKAIAILPDFAWAYDNLGRTLQDQKRLVEAEAAFRKAIELKPDDARAYNRLGVLLCDYQKKPVEAEASFRKAIALQPKDAKLHFNLGNALMWQRKLEQAEAAYRKAIELKPDLPEPYNQLAYALSNQSKLVEAEVSFRKAIALQPKDAKLHVNLGNVLLLQKKLAEAEAAYRKAITLQPDFAEAYNNLGLLLRDQKKLGDAVQAFRKADQLLPTHADIRNNLRQAERLLQLDPKLAACLLGKQHPASPQEAIELAGCAIYREHYRAAARFFSDAFREDPKLVENLEAWYRYNASCSAALAAAGKGKDAAALAEAERATLRRQALDWLWADLKAYTALLDKNKAATPAVQQRLAHCLEDTDLAGVRDVAALAKLPEAERDAWKKLWAGVEALHKRCQEK
jgi:tetratricopeptide (TPR) repeat protein